MTREIKFRAWDKIQEKMFEVSSIHGLERNDDNEFKYVNGNGVMCDWKDAILMQFTGLKDKNGKEIYEGDILETNFYVSQGVFEQITGSVKYYAPSFVVQRNDGHRVELHSFSDNIGNIYENPELLN